ncbi:MULTISPECIES: GntR family transcriptional regulator [unclassified Fusibacter]|uniref:GntR family transcriptional regulator n=1 Tax=unclassified Fusibacter TaxID=2624464 RepID=UPI0010133713|nr:MULTISPECIES: GntR family transcriptional regulator [unclassified Fusibacter]MCK8060147.1 GntR family transcriptional regulator [Fusibacter sp. A2]NPE22289.1 GntR family transcriptional regulator [Fusibacter sp. A1]RXV61062.1 GntR family transcriptional regulator [Fusibacter sp. A1]
MEFKLHIPIFIQIMDAIKMDIIHGRRKSGDLLPSVRDLAAQMKVNPNTVQKAYQEMESEGLCESKRGLGRFIVEKPTLQEELKKQLVDRVTDEYIKEMYQIGIHGEALINLIREKS